MNTFTKEEISSHHTTHDLWVIYKDKVYDLTSFLFDHPGGEELLLSHGGSDISLVLEDENIHLHSDSALEILKDYCIGSITDENNGKNMNTIDSATHLNDHVPVESVVLQDLNEKFIDITKPMLRQVYYSTFSKEEYIKQVHIPRYSKNSPPIFGGFLEHLTKTYWWVIPLFWGPFVVVLYNWARIYLSQEVTSAVWVIGLFTFTLIEYSLHRFLFHMDENLPDNRLVMTIHFLIHGVHHFLPMDRMRLVLPPALGAILSFPIWGFCHLIAPQGMAEAFISGAYLGLILYDMVHYYSHHGKPWGSYLKSNRLSMYQSLYLLVVTVLCISSVSSAYIGESCVKSRCTNNLICITDAHPVFSSTKNHTCSIPFGPELQQIAKNLADGYTKVFMDQLESNITHNIHALGSPLLHGIHVEGVIPSTESGTKSGVNDYLKTEFAKDCIATFPVIARQTIRSIVNGFVLGTPKGLSDAQMKTRKTQLLKNIQSITQQKMANYVQMSWKLFKEDESESLKEVKQDVEIDAGITTSLQRRRCERRACQRIRNFFQRIGRAFVRIGKGIVTLVEDGVEVVMDIIDGIEGFARAVADGNIREAFAELGKGFTNAFQKAFKIAQTIGRGIWKGLKAIGDEFVKFGKYLATIKPSTWAFIVCSLVLGIALSVIFPPLAVAILGVSGWTAIGVTVTAEISLLLIQGFLIDPHIKKGLEDKIDKESDKESDKNPDTLTSTDGRKITLDKNRNEYCFTDSGDYFCMNEKLKQYCIIQKDFPDLCQDNQKRWYVMQDGVKSYWNAETGQYSPPLNKLNIHGADRTYDKQRKEYCYLTKDKEKFCWNDTFKTDCLIEQNADAMCFDSKGWFMIQDKVKYYYVASSDSWVKATNLRK